MVVAVQDRVGVHVVVAIPLFRNQTSGGQLLLGHIDQAGAVRCGDVLAGPFIPCLLFIEVFLQLLIVHLPDVLLQSLKKLPGEFLPVPCGAVGLALLSHVIDVIHVILDLPAGKVLHLHVPGGGKSKGACCLLRHRQDGIGCFLIFLHGKELRYQFSEGILRYIEISVIYPSVLHPVDHPDILSGVIIQLFTPAVLVVLPDALCAQFKSRLHSCRLRKGHPGSQGIGLIISCFINPFRVIVLRAVSAVIAFRLAHRLRAVLGIARSIDGNGGYLLLLRKPAVDPRQVKPEDAGKAHAKEHADQKLQLMGEDRLYVQMEDAFHKAMDDQGPCQCQEDDPGQALHGKSKEGQIHGRRHRGQDPDGHGHLREGQGISRTFGGPFPEQPEGDAEGKDRKGCGKQQDIYGMGRGLPVKTGKCPGGKVRLPSQHIGIIGVFHQVFHRGKVLEQVLLPCGIVKGVKGCRLQGVDQSVEHRSHTQDPGRGHDAHRQVPAK